MNNLKNKSIDGFLWSIIENVLQKGITFIIGIILARILLPEEFGLIGMITIFIAISTTFITSGFGVALIRKKDCRNDEYSTIFYFNFFVGLVSYFVLFIAAPYVSDFFNESQLINILRVFSVVLIIDSLSIIQRTILTKELNFKLQTKISIISSVTSGSIAVYMAYKGYGVWSLVYKQIIGKSINTILLWLWNKWRPLLIFSTSSFKSLFAFSYKLLISSLVDTIFRNIYLVVIGKFFSAEQLGFYTRADQFKSLFTENFSSVLGRVLLPVFTQVEGDDEKIKLIFKKVLISTFLISSSALLGLAAISKPLIIVLLGEKWIQSIKYLQLLSIGAILFPLHVLNIGMLQLKGRSDLYLKIEIVKKLLAIPVILIGIYYGITALIIGFIVNSVISFLVNSYYTGKLIKYPAFLQIKDIIPSLFLSLSMASMVYFFGRLFHNTYLITLIFQVFLGFTSFILLAELFKMNSYLFIKNNVLEKFRK